ncbi:hypothetical protein SteCoe_36956 [Stentor coeruleus]|uniref:Uncharacterized protein n=1 Tax=Stentor coeruleus TaxID=5963 RepID=A0A1R2AP88_9CILI|nr:hypothetical protein SteCoe_36956 [Stentor coeruleus]
MGTCICKQTNKKQIVTPKSEKFTLPICIEAKNTSVRNSIAVWIFPSEYSDMIEKLKMEKLNPLNLNLSELYRRRKLSMN